MATAFHAFRKSHVLTSHAFRSHLLSKHPKPSSFSFPIKISRHFASSATPFTDEKSIPATRYNHLAIEQKWQKYWDEHRTFVAVRRPGKPKKYVLDMFPYPSGAGLHVGHPEGYTATDIMARYWRMRDIDVLHPMGWDAFGLPAEQHAINTGTHPSVTTYENIATFKRQLKSLGFSYDWTRELSTTDDQYVRWTQWIFLQLFKKGLAFQSEVSVNWCPKLGTVLANEEVINGRSERGDHPVIRQPLRQWVLKITQYADRLEAGLQNMQWPEGTLSAQKQWIGRSEGASIQFSIAGQQNLATKTNASGSNTIKNAAGQVLEVFTTRPDTLMGVTYLVLAPEHPLVDLVTTPAQQSAVDAYRRETLGKSDLERTAVGGMSPQGKSGVFTGGFATHPITQALLPIWIADYVLAGYGTGAVMAVPAHDERDFQFAEKFHLPVKQVIFPPTNSNNINNNSNNSTNNENSCTLPYTEEGILQNSSDEFDSLTSTEAKKRIIEKLQELHVGAPQISYKLRDWVFSRQRYWGEPIPIYFPVEFAVDVDPNRANPAEGTPHTIRYDQPIPVDEADLPLKLPDMNNFQPGDDPQGCLARANHWRYFRKDGKWYARETNTMPQWAGSCWYYLRFTDPSNQNALFSSEASRWLPVDLYVGGQEHAVLHLLYARFWHKVLYDIGIVDHDEPFTKLVHQGMILGADGEKMSKSRGNVINPDDVVQTYGADALRLYEMFMGPLEATKPWQTGQLMGVVRFRDRCFALAQPHRYNTTVKMQDAGDLVSMEVHRAVKKVTEDIEKMSFNTAISAMMILVNKLSSMDAEQLPKEAVETLTLLLSPFAPHVAEEMWSLLGHEKSLAYAPWPEYDPRYIEDLMMKIAVQVNGKVRSTLEVEKTSTEAAVIALAMEQANVVKFTKDKNVKKTIYIPGRILNIIV